METKSIQCANCGASIKYEVNAVEMGCNYCGSALKIVHSNDRQDRTEVIQLGSEIRINQAEAYLTRGFLFLEDQDFHKADEYFEKCLDLMPMEDRAYIGQLLVKLHLAEETLLLDLDQDLLQHKEFEKALRFAPPDRKAKYDNYREKVQENEAERDRMKKEELARNQQIQEEKRVEEEKRRQQEREDQQRRHEIRAERDRLEREARAAWRRKYGRLMITIALSMAVILSVFYYFLIKPAVWDYAVNYNLEQGNIVKAEEVYAQLPDWWVSENELEARIYKCSLELLEQKNYVRAEVMIQHIHPYKDTGLYLDEINRIYIRNDLKGNVMPGTIDRVLRIPTTDPEFAELAKQVVEKLPVNERYIQAILLWDELVLLDESLREQRNDYCYDLLLNTEKASVKQQLLEALPDDYRDVAEQRAELGL